MPVVALFVACGLLPALAVKAEPSAAEGMSELESAERRYSSLDYEGANTAAALAITRGHLTHEALTRTCRLLALTYAVLDKADAARDAFLRCLTADPEFQVDPKLGPKVNAPFVDARGRFRALAVRPDLQVHASVTPQGGALETTLHDTTHAIHTVRVSYRWTAGATFTVSKQRAAQAAHVYVSPPSAGQTRLEYFAEGLDEHENVVFEAGNATAPKSALIAVETPPNRSNNAHASVVASPWFWAIGGLVLAGGGVAAYFAFRPTATPTQASLSPVLQCGSDLCR